MTLSAAHGGKRTGAGRPKGTGKHKTATKPMRIPVELADDVLELISGHGLMQELPFFEGTVQAGTLTSMADMPTSSIHLWNHLVSHPKDTFVTRAKGESMVNAGIFDGDLLVVDQIKKAKPNDIVIASVDGAFTVKRLVMKQKDAWLYPENPQFEPIKVGREEDLILWGVVTHTIHSIK